MPVLTGVLVVLEATVAMTAVMTAVGDEGPPPTANLLDKFADVEPDDHKTPGMVLHLVYGVGAGAVFAVGAPLVGLGVNSAVVAVGLGLAYGVALTVGGMVFWMRLLGVEPEKRTTAAFGAAHLTYGVVLGAFLGSGPA
jgi:hypothetical protein